MEYVGIKFDMLMNVDYSILVNIKNKFLGNPSFDFEFLDMIWNDKYDILQSRKTKNPINLINVGKLDNDVLYNMALKDSHLYDNLIVNTNVYNIMTTLMKNKILCVIVICNNSKEQEIAFNLFKCQTILASDIQKDMFTTIMVDDQRDIIANINLYKGNTVYLSQTGYNLNPDCDINDPILSEELLIVILDKVNIKLIKLFN